MIYGQSGLGNRFGNEENDTGHFPGIRLVGDVQGF